jgi:hypothetical protein
MAQGRNIAFPRVVNNAGERTGIAVVNMSATATANLSFSAFAPTGQLVAGTGITNPATRTLGPGKQLAVVVTQLFGDAFVTDSAWVFVQSDQQQVAGFYLFFDDAVNILDGADARFAGQGATTLTFTETAGGLLSLANSSLSLTANASASLMSDTGAVVSTVTLPSIPASGCYSATLASLFPVLATDPNPLRTVTVTSNNPLHGFMLFGDRTRYVGGLNGLRSGADARNVLYAPQYVEDTAFRSRIRVVSLANTPVPATLQLFGKDGIQLGNTVQRTIPARGAIQINDPADFGRPRSGPRTEGYIQISAPQGAFLVGSVSFGDPAGTTFLSALPLVGDPQTDIVYSQVAVNDLFFTGAAVINTSTNNSTVTVWVYETGGKLLGVATRPVKAGAREQFVLTELIPGLGNVNAGYFRLRTDQSMSSFAVFGTQSLSALSAVPSQVVAPAPLPPFYPRFTSSFDTLAAGAVPNLTGTVSETANELTVKSVETRLDHGRVDIANLTAGKVLATGQIEVDQGIFAEYRHTVVSNDGTTVRTALSFPAFNATLFDGVLENTGADGARLLVTISSDEAADNQTASNESPVPIKLGKLFVLPSPAGTKVTTTITFTSVKFNGVSTTHQTTDSFTTVP